MYEKIIMKKRKAKKPSIKIKLTFLAAFVIIFSSFFYLAYLKEQQSTAIKSTKFQLRDLVFYPNTSIFKLRLIAENPTNTTAVFGETKFILYINSASIGRGKAPGFTLESRVPVEMFIDIDISEASSKELLETFTTRIKEISLQAVTRSNISIFTFEVPFEIKS